MSSLKKARRFEFEFLSQKKFAFYSRQNTTVQCRWCGELDAKWFLWLGDINTHFAMPGPGIWNPSIASMASSFKGSGSLSGISCLPNSTPYSARTPNAHSTPYPGRAPNTRTPRTPQSNTTRARSEFSTSFLNSSCFVAIVEGRGSARGEVGVASICLNNPTLIISQISDTNTYVRTLAKLSYLNPMEILLPFNGSQGEQKLEQDIAEHFPHCNIVQIQRRFFNEAKGLQVVKRLCAPEYSCVELLVQQKYYG